MANEPTISVVVPVYNSEQSLTALVERLEPVLRAHSSDFEIVLVDDGSRDGSWNVVCDLATASPWIRGVHLMRNYGQHNAILCGVRVARFDVIATMDDDLQHPPEELPKLLALLGEGHDVVYGTPEQQQHGLGRNLASRITKLALRGAMGAESAANVSAFRVFRRDLRRSFEGYQGEFVSIDVLLTWGTTRFAACPVRHDPRRIGASNYSLRKLLVHALNMMTGYSSFPLQIASLTGFAFTLFGMVLLAYVVVGWLIRGSSVAGFTFLASVISLFSGAQLFALGIIGEYLARVHSRTMAKPTYAVRSRTDDA